MLNPVLAVAPRRASSKRQRGGNGAGKRAAATAGASTDPTQLPCCTEVPNAKKGTCHPNCLKRNNWYTCNGSKYNKDCAGQVSLCLVNDGPPPANGWGADCVTKDDMDVAVPSELQDIIAPVRAKYSGSGWLCSECYPEQSGVVGSGWL